MSTGSDVNDGTQAHPVKTLAKAFQLATTLGSRLVKMEGGTYPEAPTFVDGISVDGGYAVPSWGLGPDLTSFALGDARATASNITRLTVITRLAFDASTPVGAGSRNTIALYSSGSSDSLTFQSCRFIAAAGPFGGAGSPGTPFEFPAGDGAMGGPGSCNGASGGAGRGGDRLATTRRGGDGGDGGQEGANSGRPGVAGAGVLAGAGGVGGGGGIRVQPA